MDLDASRWCHCLPLTRLFVSPDTDVVALTILQVLGDVPSVRVLVGRHRGNGQWLIHQTTSVDEVNVDIAIVHRLHLPSDRCWFASFNGGNWEGDLGIPFISGLLGDRLTRALGDVVGIARSWP